MALKQHNIPQYVSICSMGQKYVVTIPSFQGLKMNHLI